MSWFSKFANRAEEPVSMDAMDPALKQALTDFKASVHAWSEAEYGRPRALRQAVLHPSWRLAAGAAMAAVLLAGSISGELYVVHQRQVQMQAAAAREAEHERQLAAQRAQAQEQAQQEDEALASIDSAVSREVPSAMQPLADLTDMSDSQ
jgi:hypothetical protein